MLDGSDAAATKNVYRYQLIAALAVTAGQPEKRPLPLPATGGPYSARRSKKPCEHEPFPIGLVTTGSLHRCITGAAGPDDPTLH
jgi:hypothetical protein